MRGSEKPLPGSDAPTLVPENSGTIAPTLTPVPQSRDAETFAGVPNNAPQPSESAAGSGLQPGFVLGGRYEILAALGEGGMGAVYKARDRELDRLVALKVIRPDLARNPAIIQRFKQELILARQITQRNVVRIFDLGEAAGIKFITMEYVEGQDLHSLLQAHKKFAPKDAVEIILQVCHALEAAHGEGIIHRDLKPQNIMQHKQGRIVVMDFGLARTVEAAGMTQTGALVGTMDYMSPEQALGKDLDQRSDLFALGLIFYELLTGKMPYKSESVVASLLKRTQERAVPVLTHDPTIPTVISNVVSKCLEPDLNLRYQTSSEILADLGAWQGGRAAATLHFPTGARPWGQTLPWHWVGGVAAVLVLAIVGFLFRDRLLRPTAKVPSGPVVSLAILPFRNASGDHGLDWLGPSLADMLSTDVGQSPQLRTVSPNRIHRIFTDLRISSETLDPEMIGRVAESSNADRVVWGQYARFGDQIRIDATLQDIKNGRSIPLKIEVPSEKEIPGAVDRLAESVRQKLALPDNVLKELKASSFQPTSKSVVALREYNEGVQLLRDGKNLQAQKVFAAATKEDPQFALAFSKLSETYANLGYDSEAEQSARKAADLSENLSPTEKYVIAATQARISKNYPKAIAAYESLAKVSPENSDVQSALGALYEDTGDFVKASEHYKKVLAGNPKDITSLLAIGRVDIKNGDPEASLNPLNQALSVAVQVDNQEQKALILQALGIAYSSLNKLEEALQNYQRSLEIKQRLGQKKGIADSMNMMADVYERMAKPDLELQHYNQALKIYQDIGDKHDAGIVLLNLGQFYQYRGKYDEGLKYLKESLQIQLETGDEGNQALCLNNMGNAYFFKGDYDTARTYFEQSLHLREKIKSPSDIADSLHNLADTSVKLGQLDQALTQYLGALDLRRNNSDKAGAAKESDSMGILFAYQGRYGAALKAREEAMNTFREQQDRSYWMAETLGGYGNALSQVGRLDEAGKPLNEALSLARELKNDTLVAQILAWQGDNFFYKGDLKSATKSYSEALQLASKTSDHDLLITLKMSLAKLSLQEGHGQGQAAILRSLAEQANRAGLKYVAIDASLSAAAASMKSGGSASSRQELERLLTASDKLPARLLLAKTHLLLGAALRLSGNTEDASREYRDAIQALNVMSKDAGDKFMDRADMKAISAEATRWAAASKS